MGFIQDIRRLAAVPIEEHLSEQQDEGNELSKVIEGNEPDSGNVQIRGRRAVKAALLI